MINPAHMTDIDGAMTTVRSFEVNTILPRRLGNSICVTGFPENTATSCTEVNTSLSKMDQELGIWIDEMIVAFLHSDRKSLKGAGAKAADRSRHDQMYEWSSWTSGTMSISCECSTISRAWSQNSTRAALRKSRVCE